MRYRKLDADDDMMFGHQQNDFYMDSVDAVAQAVGTRLRMWAGEFFLDTSDGTAYQNIMGTRSQKNIDPIIRARILGTPGVTSVESLEVEINSTIRQATITARISTIYGAVTVTGGT